MERDWVDDDEEDRISKLPEFLIHQILSYLPSKDAARTTVLSQTWLQSYSSSPFLSFDEGCFVVRSPENVENRYPFFDFVNNTLSRYTRLNLRIHKLQIRIFHVDHPPAHLLLDKSLSVAIDSGVKELSISVVETHPYTLPSAMFESPKMLTYLKLDNCKFPQTNSNYKTIIFPFLKTLLLNRAYIDDVMLQKLLLSSPSLEKIVFVFVSGLKKFRVCDLGKLEALDIYSHIEIDVDLEAAPSLCFFKFRSGLLKVGRDLQSTNLKRLELYKVSISDDSLNDLVTNSPLLEHLEVDACDRLVRIDFASDSLKHLNLNYCKNLVEAKIDAPSLLELIYSSKNMLSLSLNNTREELMTYIHFNHCEAVSDAWFHQLRELLQIVIRARVSFALSRFGIALYTTINLRENPLPPKRQTSDCLFVCFPCPPMFDFFVKMLFSSFRPTSIVTGSPAGAFDFTKHLSSELITATRNSNCCTSAEIKCWRHYLKDINVEVYEDSLQVWQPLHKEALQCDSTFMKKIRFNLEWYAQV